MSSDLGDQDVLFELLVPLLDEVSEPFELDFVEVDRRKVNGLPNVRTGLLELSHPLEASRTISRCRGTDLEVVFLQGDLVSAHQSAGVLWGHSSLRAEVD